MTGPGIGDGNRRPILGGGERLQEAAERQQGGGEKYHPFDYARAREILLPQLERLIREVGEMPIAYRAPHVIVEATVLPNYISNSDFPEQLLARTGMYPVGTRQSRAPYETRKQRREDEPTKTLLLAGPDEGIAALGEIVQLDPGVIGVKLWDEVRTVADIGLSRPERVVRFDPERVGAGEIITWEAVLSPIGRPGEQRNAWIDSEFEKFVTFVRSRGGDVDVDYRRIVNDVTFVPVSWNPESALRAYQFNLLRVMRPMPQIRPNPVSVMRGAPAQLPFDVPTAPPRSDLTVAVFDGGVDPTNPYFAPYVSLEELTPEAADRNELDHGAMVTSALLFGPLDPAGGMLPIPPARVAHFRVWPPPHRVPFDDELYWILDRVLETIRDRDFRFVNLSLGPNREVDDDGEPHRWTAELDSLVSERGTFIVSAAGNNGELDAIAGLNRVMVPADMVNGMSVGACTTRSNGARITRAAYSAVGPGRPGQRIQPTGVSFGGDRGSSEFNGFGYDGRVRSSLGTSFAAPFALRGVLDLAVGLEETRATPPSLRGFAAHFAERRKKGHKTRDLGYGRFLETYDRIWECDPNEVTLIYTADLVRGAPTAMRLPVPDGLDPEVFIALEWTLVYSSSVDPADATEYTRAGVETVFRPHENMRILTDEKTKKTLGTFDVLRQRDEVAALLAKQAIRISKIPQAQSGWRRFRPEQMLRDAGKWETLSRGQIKLPSAALFRPRLDLLHLARERGVLIHDVPPLPITLIVSIRAPEGVMLYDDAIRQYGVLTPLVQRVPGGAVAVQVRAS